METAKPNERLIELTEGDVYDGWVWDGVEWRELGGWADWTVKEDLAVEDDRRSGSGRDLFSPQIRREEIALVSGEVVVDSEAALSKEHIRRVRSISLQHKTNRPSANPFKITGVKWLHFKVFRSIVLDCQKN